MHTYICITLCRTFLKPIIILTQMREPDITIIRPDAEFHSITHELSRLVELWLIHKSHAGLGDLRLLKTKCLWSCAQAHCVELTGF